MSNNNMKCLMLQSHGCCCHGDVMVRVDGVSELSRYGGPPCCYTQDFYMEHYKYRVEMYLNGTGTGLGTHVSLRLVTRQSPYDNALSWPPNFRMRLTLVNQYGDGHLEYTLCPDAEGNFTQPQWETFIPLDKLRHPHSLYVREDVMFIKVTKVKNPVPTTFDSISGVTCLNS